MVDLLSHNLEIILLIIFFIIWIIIQRKLKKNEEEFEFVRNIIKENPQLSEDELIDRIEESLRFRYNIRLFDSRDREIMRKIIRRRIKEIKQMEEEMRKKGLNN